MHTFAETFANELVGRGLPAEYAQRVAAELADHHGDLVEEICATSPDEGAARDAATARLGERKQLVKQVVSEYQRRHWVGRWPLLTFLVGAPLAVVALWIAMGACFWTIGQFVPDAFLSVMDDGLIDWSERGQEWAVWSVVLLVLPMLVVTKFAQLALRTGLGWPWVVLSALAVAALVGQPRLGLDEQRAMGMLAVSFDFSPSGIVGWYFGQGMRHVAQWLIPLVTGLLVFWQARHGRGGQVPVA